MSQPCFCQVCCRIEFPLAVEERGKCFLTFSSLVHHKLVCIHIQLYIWFPSLIGAGGIDKSRSIFRTPELRSRRTQISVRSVRYRQHSNVSRALSEHLSVSGAPSEHSSVSGTLKNSSRGPVETLFVAFSKRSIDFLEPSEFSS